LKKLISFIWPQTKKVQSVYNGLLEVTLTNGKKILDSENANYSYGTLQRVMEKSLDKIDLLHVNSVLLLGLGGGSVIDSLNNKFDFKGSITAVELDPVVVRIAKEEFGIATSDHLRIIESDAYTFVESSEELFDLIIVDLFIDDRVPEKFYSRDFCERILKLSAQNGKIIFNLGLKYQASETREQVIDFFKNHSGLKSSIHENMERLSSVLIAIDERK
jgi:spermidine synthase